MLQSHYNFSMLEVHETPSAAKSDVAQRLTFDALSALMAKIDKIAK